MSAESPQRVAPQESGGREDARRGEARAGLPRRRADARPRIAARQNVCRPQHARRRGERVAGRRGSGRVAGQNCGPSHRAGAPEPKRIRNVSPAYPIREPYPERAEADQDGGSQHGRPPQRLEKSKKCAARSRPERAARVASRPSSAATPRRARRVARLRADAPATRQHAIAAGAASPATPLANAADELMPMTAAAAMGQT